MMGKISQHFYVRESGDKIWELISLNHTAVKKGHVERFERLSLVIRRSRRVLFKPNSKSSV